jgi:hypothetical protein
MNNTCLIWSPTGTSILEFAREAWEEAMERCCNLVWSAIGYPVVFAGIWAGLKLQPFFV